MILQIDIELSLDEVNLLKTIREQSSVIINNYNSFAWGLEYLGLVGSTYLDKDGQQTHDLSFYLTGLGKQVAEKL